MDVEDHSGQFLPQLKTEVKAWITYATISEEDFEARAAAARRSLHEAIMEARVWFMNVNERCGK